MRASTRYAVNAFSNWAYVAVSALVGLILLPYALERLGDARFGIYVIVGSMLSVLALLDLGLSGAVSRFSSRDQSLQNFERLRETISTALLLLGTLGVLGALGLVIGLPWIKSFFPIDERHYSGLIAMAVCLAVGFAIHFASVPAAGILIGAGRYELLNSTEILGNLVRLSLVFVLFESFTPSLLLFGLASVAHQVVRFGGFNSLSRFLVMRARLYSVSSISRDALRRLSQFSLINALGVLGYLTLMQGPSFVIGKMLGLEMVSAYAPAFLVAMQLGALLAGLTSPLIPLAAREAETNEGRRLGEWSMRLGRLVCTLSLLILVPALLFAPTILRLWIGPDYVWTALVFRITVAAQLFSLIQAANYYLLLGGGKIRYWVFSEVTAAVIAMAAAILGQLWFNWGLLGITAAVASVVAIRGGLVLPFICCRQFRISVRRYYLHVYGLPLIPCALAATVSFGLTRVFPPATLISLLWQVLLNVVIFATAAWFIALSVADRETVGGLMRSVVQRVWEARPSQRTARLTPTEPDDGNES